MPTHAEPRRNPIVITIPDFSLGMMSDDFASLSSTLHNRNGAATVENTYRCHSDPRSGALVPLPKRTVGPTRPMAMTPDAAHYALNQAEYLLDLVVMGPATNHSGAYDEPVLALIGFWGNPTGTGPNYSPYVIGTRRFRTSGVSTDFSFRRGSLSYPSGWVVPSGCFVKTRRLLTSIEPENAGPGDFLAVIAHQTNVSFNAWTTTAMSAAEQAMTTYDTDLATTTPEGPGHDPTGVTSAWFYPNTANTNDHKEIGFAKSHGFLLIGHQGRLVQAGGMLVDWDASTDHLLEYIAYTQVNHLMSVGEGSGLLFVVEENPSNYGAGYSTNANELFLVKFNGGAVAMRGDLADPTIIRLPYVESTGGITTMGAPTPVGFVYGTRNGVYAWKGGDTATRLSEQLDGLFFLAGDNPIYNGNIGRFAYRDPFVFCPNDYLYDTRTKAWWRLEDTTVAGYYAHNCFDPGAFFGFVFAGRHKRDASSTVLYDLYVMDQGANTYSWQSQPLIGTTDRRLRFEEIRFRALAGVDSFGATITVTLTGFNERGTVTTFTTAVTLDPDDSSVQDVLIPIKPMLIARSVKIRFQVSDGGTAPKLLGPVEIHATDDIEAARTDNPDYADLD